VSDDDLVPPQTFSARMALARAGTLATKILPGGVDSEGREHPVVRQHVQLAVIAGAITLDIERGGVEERYGRVLRQADRYVSNYVLTSTVGGEEETLAKGGVIFGIDAPVSGSDETEPVTPMWAIECVRRSVLRKLAAAWGFDIAIKNRRRK
jgi:hypothetical protein